MKTVDPTAGVPANLGWTDICLDLETLGTSARAVIIQIGAVQFDLEEESIGQTFEAKPDWHQSGRKVDRGTLEFWFRQTEGGHKPPNGTEPLETALRRFAAWLGEIAGKRSNGQLKLRVWSNGPSFDAAILADAFSWAGISRPWSYWEERCVRTITANARDLGWRPCPPRPIAVHDAVVDATNEAEDILDAASFLASQPETPLPGNPDYAAAWAVYREQIPDLQPWPDQAPHIQSAWRAALDHAVSDATSPTLPL